MDPKLVQQLTDLYQQLYKNLTASAAKAMAEAIPDVVTLGKEISRVQTNLSDVTESFEGIASSLKGSIQELSKFNITAGSTKKSFKDLQSIAQKLSSEQSGFNNLSEKELKSLRAKAILNAQNLKQNIRSGELTAEQASEANHVVKQTGILVDLLNQRLDQENKINAALGISGTLVKGMSNSLDKLGMGGLLNIDKINEKVRQTAEQVTANGTKSAGLMGKTKVLGTAISETFSSLGKSIMDPAVIFTFLIAQANKADKQTTELAKSLSLSKLAAAGVRQEFVGFSRSIGDTAITTDKLLESFGKLSKQLGFNVPRSKDLLKEFTTLTTKIGVSEESAAGLSRLTLATGKNARAVTTEALGTAQALQSQYGIQLDNREILNEVGSVSGQLLANFKGNPKAIAEAVTQTKLLGTTLAATKAQGESLLNFESSIENELKAELLTGREINLENARMAALKGDQVTVAKELANQAIDFNTFSEMNVVQQRALAESLGTSSDALSDQLLKQQMLGKSREEVVAIGGEEAAQRLEQIAAQDKFNNAITKLQDLVGNLVAGPLGTMLDMFASLVSTSSGLAAVLGGVMLINLMKMVSVMRKAKQVSMGGAIIEIIKSAYQSLGGLPGIGLILAGSAAAAGIAYLSSQASASEKADDMVGYGARTLITPTGNVALNNSDTVIAGTNLFKGDDVTSFPKGALSMGGKGNDNTETNSLLKQLIGVNKAGNDKQSIVMMNDRQVGSTLVQNSYQVA
jgi:hypothetical protein